METYTLKIWSGSILLHKGSYQFNNLFEAQQYHLGLVKGFELCGKNPNKMNIKKV